MAVVVLPASCLDAGAPLRQLPRRTQRRLSRHGQAALSVVLRIHGGGRPEGSTPLSDTFEDGHREVALCEAILTSHRERCWVDLL